MISERDLFVTKQFSQLIVSFSAGKDSTVCARWAAETGKPFRLIMADGLNEPPDTQEYIKYIERELCIKVETYTRPGNDFFSIVERRGMWPIHGKCLVSRTVKVDDFAWYLKETNTPLDALIILGQRRSESKRRSKLDYFDHALRSGRAGYRPILDWSIGDVMSYLADSGIMAHPAYSNGRKRVGCVWCVNHKLDDLLLDSKLYPERCQKLRELRASIGLSSIPELARQDSLFEQPTSCIWEAVHCE